MRPLLLTVPAAAVLVLAACQPVPTADEYASILPDERVAVNLPAPEAGARAQGELSELYALTANTTDDVNGMIAGILVAVDTVTEFPATWSDTEENTAVWGPWMDALDPVATMLWVHHDVETDEYEWAIAQRPRASTSDEDWVAVIVGHVNAGATEAISSGSFAIDFSAASAVNPLETASGAFYTEYDIRADGVSAVAAFEGFSEGGDALDAGYSYEQTFGGDGAMDLVAKGDIHESGSAEETIVVRSRWMSTGAGRSDAYITEGDLGDVVATASDCWDTSFLSTYWIDSWGGESYGDVATCAFAEPEFNESEDVAAR